MHNIPQQLIDQIEDVTIHAEDLVYEGEIEPYKAHALLDEAKEVEDACLACYTTLNTESRNIVGSVMKLLTKLRDQLGAVL